MELPWALLALAGMAAADLGDSLGTGQRGTGVWGAARGLCQGGVMGLGTAGGSPPVLAR